MLDGGGRSWQKPLAALALMALMILANITYIRAAPVQPEEPEGGCYYMFQHYNEGDRIITNEPCLNCTCHDSMLMCFLKVCPFAKPIGQDCVIEKRPDQCCPIITCPEVPVPIMSMNMSMSMTTARPTTTTLAPYEPSSIVEGCNIDGQYYPDGAQVPSDPRNPCDLCYCIRNHTACVMQECILHVDGCTPIFEEGVCCPVRYDCDSTGLIPSGTSPAPTVPSDGCMKDGVFYADGAFVSSENPCDYCYCMHGDIVCAVQECGKPLEQVGGNCVPVPPPAGQCCPEAYECFTTPSEEIAVTSSQGLISSGTLAPGNEVSSGPGAEEELSTDVLVSSTSSPSQPESAEQHLSGTTGEPVLPEQTATEKPDQSSGMPSTSGPASEIPDSNEPEATETGIGQSSETPIHSSEGPAEISGSPTAPEKPAEESQPESTETPVVPEEETSPGTVKPGSEETVSIPAIEVSQTESPEAGQEVAQPAPTDIQAPEGPAEQSTEIPDEIPISEATPDNIVDGFSENPDSLGEGSATESVPEDSEGSVTGAPDSAAEGPVSEAAPEENKETDSEVSEEQQTTSSTATPAVGVTESSTDAPAGISGEVEGQQVSSETPVDQTSEEIPVAVTDPTAAGEEESTEVPSAPEVVPTSTSAPVSQPEESQESSPAPASGIDGVVPEEQPATDIPEGETTEETLVSVEEPPSVSVPEKPSETVLPDAGSQLGGEGSGAGLPDTSNESEKPNESQSPESELESSTETSFEESSKPDSADSNTAKPVSEVPDVATDKPDSVNEFEQSVTDVPAGNFEVSVGSTNLGQPEGEVSSTDPPAQPEKPGVSEEAEEVNTETSQSIESGTSSGTTSAPEVSVTVSSEATPEQVSGTENSFEAEEPNSGSPESAPQKPDSAESSPEGEQESTDAPAVLVGVTGLVSSTESENLVTGVPEVSSQEPSSGSVDSSAETPESSLEQSSGTKPSSEDEDQESATGSPASSSEQNENEEQSTEVSPVIPQEAGASTESENLATEAPVDISEKPSSGFDAELDAGYIEPIPEQPTGTEISAGPEELSTEEPTLSVGESSPQGPTNESEEQSTEDSPAIPQEISTTTEWQVPGSEEPVSNSVSSGMSTFEGSDLDSTKAPAIGPEGVGGSGPTTETDNFTEVPENPSQPSESGTQSGVQEVGTGVTQGSSTTAGEEAPATDEPQTVSEQTLQSGSSTGGEQEGTQTKAPENINGQSTVTSSTSAPEETVSTDLPDVTSEELPENPSGISEAPESVAVQTEQPGEESEGEVNTVAPETVPELAVQTGSAPSGTTGTGSASEDLTTVSPASTGDSSSGSVDNQVQPESGESATETLSEQEVNTEAGLVITPGQETSQGPVSESNLPENQDNVPPAVPVNPEGSESLLGGEESSTAAPDQKPDGAPDSENEITSQESGPKPDESLEGSGAEEEESAAEVAVPVPSPQTEAPAGNVPSETSEGTGETEIEDSSTDVPHVSVQASTPSVAPEVPSPEVPSVSGGSEPETATELSEGPSTDVPVDSSSQSSLQEGPSTDVPAISEGNGGAVSVQPEQPESVNNSSSTPASNESGITGSTTAVQPEIEPEGPTPPSEITDPEAPESVTYIPENELGQNPDGESLAGPAVPETSAEAVTESETIPAVSGESSAGESSAGSAVSGESPVGPEAPETSAEAVTESEAISVVPGESPVGPTVSGESPVEPEAPETSAEVVTESEATPEVPGESPAGPESPETSAEAVTESETIPAVSGESSAGSAVSGESSVGPEAPETPVEVVTESEIIPAVSGESSSGPAVSGESPVGPEAPVTPAEAVTESEGIPAVPGESSAGPAVSGELPVAPEAPDTSAETVTESEGIPAVSGESSAGPTVTGESPVEPEAPETSSEGVTESETIPAVSGEESVGPVAPETPTEAVPESQTTSSVSGPSSVGSVDPETPAEAVTESETIPAVSGESLTGPAAPETPAELSPESQTTPAVAGESSVSQGVPETPAEFAPESQTTLATTSDSSVVPAVSETPSEAVPESQEATSTTGSRPDSESLVTGLPERETEGPVVTTGTESPSSASGPVVPVFESEKPVAVTEAPRPGATPSGSQPSTMPEVAATVVETEPPLIAVTQTTPPSVSSQVPGEGSCLLDGITYANKQEVPAPGPCQVHCRCESSIVRCKLIECPPAPDNFVNCRPYVKPGKCCPSYDCDALNSTLPEATSEVSGVTEPFLVSTSSESPAESSVSTTSFSSSSEATSGEATPSSTAAPSAGVESSSVQPETSSESVSSVSTSTQKEEEVSIAVTEEVLRPSSDDSSAFVETGSFEVNEENNKPAQTTTTTESTAESESSQPASSILSQEVTPESQSSTGSAQTSTTAVETTTSPSTTTVASVPVEPEAGSPEEETDPELVIGPTACLFDGKVYVSAQQIPREDPCDFCFCFRGDIICLQQSCPPPIPGCYEEPIGGFCCPRYECPVHQATHNVSVQSVVNPPLSSLPGAFDTRTHLPLPSTGYGATMQQVEVNGCEIQGEFYEQGKIVPAASGPCLECRCGNNGMMECDPRECQPEPMLRKVIAVAGSRRRRHVAADGSIWLTPRRS